VEALFVEDDSTALRLYELGKLTFLRRFPSAQIPSYRHRPDFVQFPMARFDYIGFGPALKNYPRLRQALSLSMDFENFAKLFDAMGRPGCPSLPVNLYNAPVCLKFDRERAKKLFEKEPWPSDVKKLLQFSKLGGDDIQRSAEWFQGQWQKNLGLLVEISAQEQTSYLRELRANPPPLFRKGIGLERPSCLAGLENFAKESPENFIHLDSTEYFEILDKLRRESNPTKAKKLCTRALHILIDESWIIPLGEIHFTMLVNPHYQGWKVNSINQLDLANLRYVPDQKPEQ
jgi:oligopeptide transport system substrate-binding protein